MMPLLLHSNGFIYRGPMIVGGWWTEPGLTRAAVAAWTAGQRGRWMHLTVAAESPVPAHSHILSWLQSIFCREVSL